ncbi:SidA/IucD/PvdA family monooxygenase [Actinocrispum wychmicini]|uniref:L-lysine N6-monooxygenase MbtG n=1 Tax=Actinocrispum wychmicini TaxID=1213861 RepID=A0A4R2JIW5_9PSEU|nr:SidA/IucD/PvdA family monooxygenase [Actinocrispum wychmicini]TCO54075.1 L-ornithine N5-oxygenase [Actinocrispum wychmicini]
MRNRDVELLAIGAGPANLALAVALEELAPDLAADSLVIERNQTVDWQPGVLVPWARSQVSFLKDLVSLRNPSSRFSFLKYLHSVGRLDEFINLGNLMPYRHEIAEYLRWVADSLPRVGVELDRHCVSVEPRRDSAGALTGWLTRLGDGTSIASRYLVIETADQPHVPRVFAGLDRRVIHSGEYRPRIAALSRDLPYRVAVVGGGQSAAEMFQALQHDLPGSDIAWIIRSVALKPRDTNKFRTELDSQAGTDSFFHAAAPAREQILRETRRTAYSGVTQPVLESLYEDRYLDRLNGRTDRRIITMTDITATEDTGDELVLDLTDRKTGKTTRLHRDLVFLGTGFTRDPPALVRRLAATLDIDQVKVTRQYRLALPEPSAAACYLQGGNEPTHGTADALPGNLAHRAAEITQDLLAHRTRR